MNSCNGFAIITIDSTTNTIIIVIIFIILIDSSRNKRTVVVVVWHGGFMHDLWWMKFVLVSGGRHYHLRYLAKYLNNWDETQLLSNR